MKWNIFDINLDLDEIKKNLSCINIKKIKNLFYEKKDIQCADIPFKIKNNICENIKIETIGNVRKIMGKNEDIITIWIIMWTDYINNFYNIKEIKYKEKELWNMDINELIDITKNDSVDINIIFIDEKTASTASQCIYYIVEPSKHDNYNLDKEINTTTHH